MKKYACPNCSYQSDLWSVKRHNERIHKNTDSEKTLSSESHYETARIQHGSDTGETQSIPIQEHNRVIEVANGWKNTSYKLKDFRNEDAQYFMEHITYLENLLNLNNINYKNYESY